MTDRRTQHPWTDLDAENLARLRTAPAGERTVFAVIRTGRAIAGGGTVTASALDVTDSFR